MLDSDHMPHEDRGGFLDNDPGNHVAVSRTFWYFAFGVSGHEKRQEVLPFLGVMGNTQGRLRLANGKLGNFLPFLDTLRQCYSTGLRSYPERTI